MKSTLYVFVHSVTGQVKGVALLSRDHMSQVAIDNLVAQGWVLQ